jgi:tetratricopeptide (TPR) repeat protein
MAKNTKTKPAMGIAQQPPGSGYQVKRPQINIQAQLSQAVELHQSGSLKAAKALYVSILSVHPWHVDALHLLGILAHQTGNSLVALNLIDKAISLNSKTSTFFNSRGLALIALARHQEALESFGKAIEINPGSAEAHCNRGSALKGLNEVEKALDSLNAAIEADPHYHLAFFNKGIVLEESGNSQAAVDSFNKAIAIKPDYAEAHCAKGSSLLALQQYPEAIAAFDQAIHYKSNLAQAFCNRGIALQRVNQYQRALEDMNHGISLQPKHAPSYFNRGVLQLQMKDFADALASYDCAIELDPQNSEAHFNKSLLYLSQKDYENGWRLYDWRFVNPGQPQAQLKTALPAWDPHKPAHKRVIVWGEQGVGDQILFGTLLAEAKSLIADLTVMVDARLIPLFERSLQGCRFIGMSQSINDHDFDAHVPLMSLGRHLRTSEQSFLQSKHPFLFVDLKRTEFIKNELQKEKKWICGIAWKSNEKKYGDKKSMRLYDLLPVLEIPGISFVNLQYGDTSEECEDLVKQTGIHIQSCPSVDNFYDLDGHAALIQACDFIVMGSNSTAHVAGSVGKETYLALSGGQGALWYWANQSQGRCLWYPSVQIFGQEHAGEWAVPVQQIRDAVLKKIYSSANAD